MGKEYLGRGPCSSLSRGMRRVSLLPLDLGRGYDAPFLVRPDRLPLGKATVCKGHRKPNREGFACAASSVPVPKFWVRIANTSGFEFTALLLCQNFHCREHRDSPFLVTNISIMNFDQKMRGKESGTIVTVSAGRFHTVAVGECGSVWSWGDGSSGQLGLGSVFIAPGSGAVGRGLQPEDAVVVFARSCGSVCNKPPTHTVYSTHPNVGGGGGCVWGLKAVLSRLRQLPHAGCDRGGCRVGMRPRKSS